MSIAYSSVRCIVLHTLQRCVTVKVLLVICWDDWVKQYHRNDKILSFFCLIFPMLLLGLLLV